MREPWVSISRTSTRFPGSLPVAAQLRKIEALCKLRALIGIAFVINGRTDVYRHAVGNERSRFVEALRRALGLP